MDTRSIRHAAAAALLAALATTPARADTPVQVGPSGRTFASAAVLCLPDAAVPGSAHAAVQAGLGRLFDLGEQPLDRVAEHRDVL